MKQTLLTMMIVFASAGTALAGGQPGSIGVGIEHEISLVGGVSANYDAGKFHAGGFIGFGDPAGPSNDTFDIGGRFFYHVASTAMADFGIGGGLGIQSQNNPAPAGRATLVFIEPSFQIRAFLTPNVALSFTGGISIGAADASGLTIDGDSIGAVSTVGVHYYFF